MEKTESFVIGHLPFVIGYFLSGKGRKRQNDQ